jgi:hypothetical protein
MFDDPTMKMFCKRVAHRHRRCHRRRSEFFSADGCVRSPSFFFSGTPKTLTVDGDNRTAAATTADGGHSSR